MKYERDANGWFPDADRKSEQAAKCGYCPAPQCGFDHPTLNIGCCGSRCDLTIAWAKANPEAWAEHVAEVQQLVDEQNRKMQVDFARAMGWH